MSHTRCIVLTLILTWAGIPATAETGGGFRLFGPIETVDDGVATKSTLSGLEPTSLAAGDVDGDGVADLMVGYAGATGRGGLAVYRGNHDAVYPFHPGAREKKDLGTFTDAPFLPSSRTIEVPDAVYFLALGDLDADGHLDVVTADRGRSRLWVMRGSDTGWRAPRLVALPGRPTALALADVGRRDGRLEVVIAVASESGAELVLLADPDRSPTSTRIALPAPATDLLVRDLAGGGFYEIAAVAGDELLVVRDPELGKAPAALERRRLDGPGRALAWGNFVRGAHGALAVLDELGGVTAFGVKDRTLGAATSLGRSADGAVGLLKSTWMPGGGDRLAAFGAQGLELRPTIRKTAPRRQILLPGVAVAALGMRLDADAFDDLVVVLAGRPDPVVLRTLKSAVTFFVNSTGPESDECPGDGSCSAGNPTPGLCNDSPLPTCTLRAALQEAAALDAASPSGVSAWIQFNISGSAPFQITDGVAADSPVTIDGTSQPGFAGTPLVEIRPADNGEALLVKGSSVVRGLALNGGSLTNSRSGVQARCSDNIVEGNYCGVEIDGVTPFPNAVGVILSDFSCGGGVTSGNRVGGTSAAARNVISGNSYRGMEIVAFAMHSGTVVEGNYVGTDKGGTAAVGNGGGVGTGHGIFFGDELVTDVTVGGTAAGAGNVIAGTNGYGLWSNAAVNTTVQGNLIGLAATGTSALPNSNGVRIDTNSASGDNNLVGGSGAGAGNRISGNAGYGLRVQADKPVSVLGNELGSVGLGNGGSGYVNVAGANLIGGTAPGEGNVIAGNGGDGVTTASFGGLFFVRGNTIFANAGLAVDLEDDGATDNDAGDGDLGPNNLQNFPVMTSAAGDGVTLQVAGTLDSLASVTYAVDVFASPNCAPGVRGDADLYLGSFDVTTNGSGVGSFNTSVSGAGVDDGYGISLTATHPSSGTSEVSPCFAASVSFEIFTDGFESGNTSAWSSTVP